jgi:hypothetical protein
MSGEAQTHICCCPDTFAGVLCLGVSIAAKNVHNHRPKCVWASAFFGGKIGIRLRADSEKRNAGVLLCFLHLRPTADFKVGAWQERDTILTLWTTSLKNHLTFAYSCWHLKRVITEPTLKPGYLFKEKTLKTQNMKVLQFWGFPKPWIQSLLLCNKIKGPSPNTGF